MTLPEDRSDMAEAARRRRLRIDRQKRDGNVSVASQLRWIGTLGWTVAMPTLLAAFLGRWLDRVLGLKMLLTASLIMAGLALGCVMAWRKIRP